MRSGTAGEEKRRKDRPFAEGSTLLYDLGPNTPPLLLSIDSTATLHTILFWNQQRSHIAHNLQLSHFFVTKPRVDQAQVFYSHSAALPLSRRLE